MIVKNALEAGTKIPSSINLYVLIKHVNKQLTQKKKLKIKKGVRERERLV